MHVSTLCIFALCAQEYPDEREWVETYFGELRRRLLALGHGKLPREKLCFYAPVSPYPWDWDRRCVLHDLADNVGISSYDLVHPSSSIYHLPFSSPADVFFSLITFLIRPTFPLQTTELSPASISTLIPPHPRLFSQSTRSYETQTDWPGGNRQCSKRRLECKYPHTSRRGQRKPQDPDATDTATAAATTTASKPRASRGLPKRSASSNVRI